MMNDHEWHELFDSEQRLRREIHRLHITRLREHDQNHDGVACYCVSATCRAAHAYVAGGRAA